MNKKELIQFFNDDSTRKYPLGYDEALLLIAEYLNNKHITKYIESFIDDVDKMWRDISE
jgi:hypothetical protein